MQANTITSCLYGLTTYSLVWILYVNARLASNRIVYLFGSILLLYLLKWQLTPKTIYIQLHQFNDKWSTATKKMRNALVASMSFCALGAIFQRFIYEWWRDLYCCHTPLQLFSLFFCFCFLFFQRIYSLSTILMRIPLHDYILLLCHYLLLLIKYRDEVNQANSPMNLKPVSLQIFSN